MSKSKFTARIDMRFIYTPSIRTDIRKTFDLERKRLASLAAAAPAAENVLARDGVSLRLHVRKHQEGMQ